MNPPPQPEPTGGRLGGLKEQAAILGQGSSGIDRQGETSPNWEGMFIKWLRRVGYDPGV